jgi:hypothetical protein
MSPAPAKAALTASIPWAFAVWWIGEGLGGLLTGTASMIMGAPGAALLYVFLALLAWPDDRGGAGIAAGRLGQALPLVGWAALWGTLAGVALGPGNRSPLGISSMLSGMQAGEPGWIRAMDGFASRVLAGHGAAASIVIAVLCTLAAIAVASGHLTRVAVIVAAILGAAFWAAEDFGGIFTGQGTDPNSGLLLIVLAVAFWPAAARPRRPGHGPCPVHSPARRPDRAKADPQVHGN